MDSAINAAARALAAGDPLGALRRVALRDDAPSLALRGIAMAQLGDLGRARDLLRRAGRRFSAGELLARARCATAEAEVALALRDLGPGERLDETIEVLRAHGDTHNATHARLLQARTRLLLGRVDEAEQTCAALDLDGAAPMLRTIAELTRADVELRRVRAEAAALALARAAEAAAEAGILPLCAEVDRAAATLTAVAARVRRDGETHALRLADVERLLASDALVVDACRRRVADVSLARRPVLFALARALAEAWPGDASRAELLRRVFEQKRANDSLRARLRVEIGRLRKALRGVAGIEATGDGFRIDAPNHADVVTLLPPDESEGASMLALLADGAPWSTTALAQALGVSARTVQRALSELETAGRVRAIGRARARRWLLPTVVGYATVLLLPSPGG